MGLGPARGDGQRPACYRDGHAGLPGVPGPSDAVLVPPADAAALSRAMLTVATDPALRRRLALNGPKVAARYTWEACAQQHRAIYGRLVRERGSAPSDS